MMITSNGKTLQFSSMNDVNLFFIISRILFQILYFYSNSYMAQSRRYYDCVTCRLRQFIRRQVWLIGIFFLNCCIAKIFGCFEDYLLPIVVIFLCPLLVEGLVEHSSSSWLRKRFFPTFPILLSLVLFHSYCKSWGNSTKCSFKQSHQELTCSNVYKT